METKLSADKTEVELTPPQPPQPIMRVPVKAYLQQQLDIIAEAQANIKIVTDGGLKVEEVMKTEEIIK